MCFKNEWAIWENESFSGIIECSFEDKTVNYSIAYKCTYAKF